MSTTEETGQPASKASLASVDARVARLETSQAETDNKIGLIQLEQHHTRELMTARFATIEAGQSAQTQKLDQFMAKIDVMIVDSIKGAGDLSASAVGRQVNERLVKLETKSDLQESWIDQMKGMGTAMRWVIGSSGLALIGSIIGLVKAFSGG